MGTTPWEAHTPYQGFIIPDVAASLFPACAVPFFIYRPISSSDLLISLSFHFGSQEPILRMTVLQHLTDWIEMFAPIADVKWLVDKGNELNKAGSYLPTLRECERSHHNQC